MAPTACTCAPFRLSLAAPRRAPPRALLGGGGGAPAGGRAHARHAAGAALAAALSLPGALAPAAALADTRVEMSDVRAEIAACQNKGSERVTSLGGGVSGISSNFEGSIEQRCLYVTAKTTNPANTPLYKADVYGNVLDSKGKGAVDKCKSSANVCGTGKMGFAPTIPVGEGEITISIPMVRSRDLEEALQQKGIDELNIFGFYAKGVAGRKPPVQPGASGTRYGVNTGEADLTQECEEFGIGCDDELIGF